MDTPRRASGAIRERTTGRASNPIVPLATDWTAADYQRLHDQLEVEIADLHEVIVHEFARSRYIATDVAAAYAELQAERGNVRPLAELKERRELNPIEDQLADAVVLGHRERADYLRRLARREPWRPDQLIPSLDEIMRQPGEGWFRR